MTSLQRYPMPRSSLLLLLTLMLPAWSSSSSSSQAITNNVFGPRDNSLSRFGFKSTSAAVKNPKSGAAVVGTLDRTKTVSASWTPACHNYSCPSLRYSLAQYFMSSAYDHTSFDRMSLGRLGVSKRKKRTKRDKT